MINSLNTPNCFENKDKHFQTQMKVVFEAFHQHPKTMLMVEVETGIMRSNITWYVDEWRKLDRIMEIKKDRCPISNYPTVGYYTTNPELYPTTNQLNLF